MPKKQGTPSKKLSGKRKAVVIGGRRFAKISAVEGIVLTQEMQSRLAEFDRKDMSPAERRRSIVRAYRKG